MLATVRGFGPSGLCVLDECCSILRMAALAQVSAIGTRGHPGDPAKRRPESACVIVSDGKANLGHRGAVLRQQCFSTLDALAQLITLGRNPEPSTESAAELPRRQAHQ